MDHDHGLRGRAPLSRRRVLCCGAVGGLLAAARPHGAEASAPGEPEGGPAPGFAFEEATVADLQRGMEAGRLSSREITAAYLERIAALDRSGPALRHVIEVNPDALAIAEALDAERRAGRPRGPLHGVPVLLKDSVDTADRMATTAGSQALAGAAVRRDAFLVTRLRAAGAVLLGKANMSEWANIRSARSSSGWSARGGQARNPYALDRSPCGSSSGSGGAVAANLCALAVGTETDGSIVCPSSVNGIVGLKPTVGLVSRAGVIPIAHSQDTPGPMARSVRDAALLLGAMAGLDPGDAPGAVAGARVEADYTRALDAEGLRGARLGVARNLAGFHPGADALFEAALEELRRRGAELVDPADVPHAGKYDDSELDVLLYELKADLGAYLSARAASEGPRSLEQVIAFNETHRDEELRYFGQELFVKAQAKGPLSEAGYRKALAANHRLSRREGIDAVMGRHRLDALVAPTAGPAWPIDLVNGDHYTGGCSTPAAVAGYPHVTVPAGFVFGLPVGLSFFGRPWSEATLLRFAYAFEQATRHRRPPRLLPSAPLA